MKREKPLRRNQLIAAPLDCPPIPEDAPVEGVTVLCVTGGYSFMAMGGTSYVVSSDAKVFRVVIQEDAQMWESDLKINEESQIWNGLIALGYTLHPTWRGTQVIPPKQQIALDFGA
jgi:hypothetical protein